MSKDEIHYDITHISFLEKLWGDGYMSPGGKKEINRLLNGLDLTEKKNIRCWMWCRWYNSKFSERLWCKRSHRRRC